MVRERNVARDCEQGSLTLHCDIASTATHPGVASTRATARVRGTCLIACTDGTPAVMTSGDKTAREMEWEEWSPA
jgi:hypothetical protein